MPLLSNRKKFHFFLSKHEKRKAIALQIASALNEAGFKVWISQHEATKGNSTDKPAMQQGVRESVSILLLLTQGIFHRDRAWVTKTEVSYGIENGSSLLCVRPVNHESAFDFDTKCHQLVGHVHPKECCQDVDEDFQSIAKAIPVAIDIAPWYTRDGGESDIQECVCGLVKRYLNGENSLLKLKREIVLQSSLKRCQSVSAHTNGGVKDGRETVVVEEKQKNRYTYVQV